MNQNKIYLKKEKKEPNSSFLQYRKDNSLSLLDENDIKKISNTQILKSTEPESVRVLREFLKTRRCDEASDSTHLCMGNPLTGKFKINDSEKLNKLIADVVSDKAFSYLNIIEKPLITKNKCWIDVDLTVNSKDNVYTDEHILTLCKFLTKYAKRYSGNNYTIAVLEKEKNIREIKNGKYRTGFHLEIPQYITDFKTLHKIRKKLIQKCRNLFTDITDDPIEKIIDEAIIQRNGFFMLYNSKPNQPYYKVQKYFNSEEGLLFTDDEPNDIEGAINFFSPRTQINNIDDDMSDSDRENEQKPTSKTEKLLNKLFSVNFHWKIEKEEQGFKCTHDSYRCLYDLDTKHSTKNHSCFFINKRNATVSCFSHGNKTFKVKDYPILTLLKQELGLIQKKNKQHFKLNTKHNFLEDFELSERIITEFNENFNNNQTGISHLFHYIFSNVFAFGEDQAWYYYKDGIWKTKGAITYLRKTISNDFLNLIKKYGNYIVEKDENEFDSLDEKENKIMEIDKTVAVLQSKKQIQDILSLLQTDYYNEDFIQQLDSKNNLLCFGKWTLDLTTCQWRKTLANDFFTRKMGIDKEDIDYQNDSTLTNFFNDTFTNTDQREYVINKLVDLLKGGNTKQKFHLWQGSGGNGKGILDTLLNQAFGSYYEAVDSSYFTEKKGSANGHSSGLIKIRGARVIMISEPRQGAKLNNSLIKKMTGGDAFQARALFKEEITFNVKGVPIIQCNNGFRLQDVNDDSVPRRLDYLHFKTTFVERDYFNQENKYHKLRDDQLPQKIKNKTGLFIGMLLNNLNQRIHHNTNDVYPEPECIKKDKMEFLTSQDEIAEFLLDNYEKVQVDAKGKTDSGDNAFYTMKDLYHQYKEYLSEEKKRHRAIKFREFKTRIMNNKIFKFKARFQPRYENGERDNHRNVLIGLISKNEEKDY